MVECTKCQKWFHYSCAQVDEKVKNMAWECKYCAASKVTETKKDQNDKSKGVKPKTKIIKSRSADQKLNLSLKDTLIDQGFGFVQTPTPVEPVTSSTAMPNISTLVIQSTIEETTSTNAESLLTNAQIPSTIVANPPLSLPIMLSSLKIPSSNIENLKSDFGNSTTQVGMESKNRDDKSISSSKSSQRKKQLAMMKLEEEFKLRTQREREFLDQKYTLLEESDENDDMEEVDRTGYTNKWIENQDVTSIAAEGEQFDLNNIQSLAIPKSNVNLAVRNIVTPSSTVIAIPHSETSAAKITNTNMPSKPLLDPTIDNILQPQVVFDSALKNPVFSMPTLDAKVLLHHVQSKLNKNLSTATISTQDRVIVENRDSSYGFPSSYMSTMSSANHLYPWLSPTTTTKPTNNAYSVSTFDSRPICSTKVGESARVSYPDSFSRIQNTQATPLIETSLTHSCFNPTQPDPNPSDITVNSHQVFNQASAYIRNSRGYGQESTIPTYSTANDRIWSNSSKGQFNSSLMSSSEPLLVIPTLSHYDSQVYPTFVPSAAPTSINVTSSQYVSQLNSAPRPTFVNHTSSQYGNHFNPSVASHSAPMSVNPTSLQYNSPIYQQTSDTRIPTSMASRVGHLSDGLNIPDDNGFGNTTLTRDQLAARQVLKKDLPHFYGNPEEWPMFLNRFKRSTQMCGYSDGENLTRLQDCLKGRAREAVRGRLLHAANVPAIIHILKIMFGRPELIINTCLVRIEKTPPPKSDDIESLISFAFSVEELCSTIVECECPTYLSDRTLLQKVTDKLPTQIKINWAMYKASVPNADLATLGNWLNDIAEATSQIVIPEVRERPSKQEKRQQDDKGTSRNRNYIATHIEPEPKTSPPESPRKSVKFCKICNKKNHSVTECRAFQGYDSKEKWAAVRKFKLCRNCLESHSWNSCKKKQQCGKDGCTSLHHSLLHSQAQRSEEKDKKNAFVKQEIAKSPVVKIETCQNNAHTSRQPVIYRIVPIIIHGPTKSVHTFAYLDDGSSFTLMEEGIAKELVLSGIPEAICLEWTRKIIRTEPDSRRVKITISGVPNISLSDDDMQKYQLLDVRTVPILGLPAQTISKEAMAKSYPYLESIPFQSYENGLPRILIGLPHAKLTNTLATVEGKWNQPIATKTRLGWVLHGANGQTSSDQSFVGTHIARKCICMEDGSLHNLVKDYIRSDNLDITPSRTILESRDNQRARYLMDNFIIRKNGRYEAPLLWRFNDVSLPDNYAMALKRLFCLESKMAKDPELAEKIKDQMKSHLQKNYIRKLTKEELKVKHANTYYLPIFNAVNPKKPMKTRIVWDGAAKYRGISLNSMLLTGPDQLTPLPDVLRRFREKCIAVGADIVEMFHQVLVRESDQHSQRFLWRDNPEDDPDVYIMQVLTFGATCSPSIAQYVKNKNAENYKQTFARAEIAITKNTYMDDLLDSVHTEAEAIKLLKDVKFINKQAGFNMRGFISNSPNVLIAIGEEVSLDSKNLNLDTESYVERVLGMFWSPKTDMFTYSLKFLDQNILKGEKSPTKREMLRMLMSIFDPLGFLSFFLVNAKIILQETWRTKLDWDDQLEDELRDRWFSWIKLLPKIEKIQIPRLYSELMSPEEPEDIQLHVFVDGSQTAYCTVAYYRVQRGNQVKCCIIGAKTKVGPIQQLSIPRMELQGAVIGSRFLTSITKSHTLQISRSYIWTDSATVIRWLNSTSRKYHQYVSCRIGEILENTNPQAWRWLKSQDNVADLGSKWNDSPNFNYNSRWFTGPEFLSKPPSDWPKNIDENESTSEEEIRPHFHIRSKLSKIFRIQPERFSKYHRMVNALAYAYRYLFNLKAKVRKECPRTGALLPEEMSQAETMLFRQAQFEVYAQEVIVLQKLRDGSAENDETLDKSSHIYNCSPYMDEKDLIRINGRIDAIKGVAESVKRPIILPRKHRITFLLVDSYHRNLNHQNQEIVVNEMRQKFWIPHLRTLVKSIKSECKKCKICRALPQPPQMAPLPEARLSISNPVFTNVGIDYFGPIIVKVPIGTRNAKRNEKRWIVLFTCLTIRAIHMEIVEGYDSDSCIMAIRNFEAVRGVVPIEYFSDNGTHFTGANNELNEEFRKMDPQVVAETMNSPCTKWNFNPPAAPHMGGVYERLIQTVKNNLEKAMPTRTPTYPMLKNFIYEITNIMNSRPLTFLPIDSAESEALTPNHFLFGSSNGMRVPCEINPDALYLKRQWKMSQQMIDQFRKRWILEYLPTLTRRTKWFDKVRPIEVGDVVIVMDEKNYRNTWPKGIVVETFKGKGDQVRSARVYITQSKWVDGTLQTKARISKRPAAKLALLDIESKENVDKLDVGKDATVKGMPTEDVDIPGGSNVGRLIDSYVWNKSSDKNSNLKRLAPPTASLPTSKCHRQ